MEINNNNYEAFFLDYYEGKLNSEQINDLFLFLEAHPNLKDEFRFFENISLHKEEVCFEDKNSLVKPEVNHRDYENYLIAEAEGDISLNEKRALNNFLSQHPEYNNDRILYSKIKLRPNEKIVFNFKESLRKKESKPVAKVIYLYRSIAVAASIMLAVLFITQIEKSDTTQPVAEVKTESKSEIKNEIQESQEKANNSEEIILANQEIKTVKQERIQNKKSNNIPSDKNFVKEQIEDNHYAESIPVKLEPVLTQEIKELQQLPLPELAENNLPREIPKDILVNTQPTLAQAAINTVENIFSGNSSINEANAGTSVVELAANGLNKIAGKELVSFEKKYNEQGEVKKFQVSAGNFGFSRSKAR